MEVVVTDVGGERVIIGVGSLSLWYLFFRWIDLRKMLVFRF